jgi:DNA primase
MNCQQANQISIIDFLISEGIQPVKKSGEYTFFSAPYRDDSTPSFTVNKRNRFKDFGSTGNKGTLIDLICLWKNLTVKEALEYIKEHTPSSLVPFSFQEQKTKYDTPYIPKSTIKYVGPKVKHKRLIEYLESRAIDPEKVEKHIKEIWYKHKTRQYYAIGFPNDEDGYEVRNHFHKRCLNRKAISHIKHDSETIIVFEGFFDCLSYMMLSDNYASDDFLILNSTAMAESAISILIQFKKVKCYMDNDKAGERTFNYFKENLPSSILISDESKFYENHKDLNEYLMALNAKRL